MRKVKRLLISAEVRFDTIPAPTDAAMRNVRDVVMTRMLTLACEGKLWGAHRSQVKVYDPNTAMWTADNIKVEVDEVQLQDPIEMG